jgi:hypothetical protein
LKRVLPNQLPSTSIVYTPVTDRGTSLQSPAVTSKEINVVALVDIYCVVMKYTNKAARGKKK